MASTAHSKLLAPVRRRWTVTERKSHADAAAYKLRRPGNALRVWNQVIIEETSDPQAPGKLALRALNESLTAQQARRESRQPLPHCRGDLRSGDAGGRDARRRALAAPVGVRSSPSGCGRVGRRAIIRRRLPIDGP